MNHTKETWSYLGLLTQVEQVSDSTFNLSILGHDPHNTLLRHQWSNFPIPFASNIGDIIAQDSMWEVTYQHLGTLSISALLESWEDAYSYLVDYHRADSAYNYLKQKGALGDDFEYDEDSLTIYHIHKAVLNNGQLYNRAPLIGFRSIRAYDYLVEGLKSIKGGHTEIEVAPTIRDCWSCGTRHYSESIEDETYCCGTCKSESQAHCWECGSIHGKSNRFCNESCINNYLERFPNTKARYYMSNQKAEQDFHKLLNELYPDVSWVYNVKRTDETSVRLTAYPEGGIWSQVIMDHTEHDDTNRLTVVSDGEFQDLKYACFTIVFSDTIEYYDGRIVPIYTVWANENQYIACWENYTYD